MPLFVWRSPALRRYADGDIIVSAVDVDTARKLAMDNFDEWWDEAHDYLKPFDEDDLARKKAMREDILVEIQSRPCKECDVVFMLGSE